MKRIKVVSIMVCVISLLAVCCLTANAATVSNSTFHTTVESNGEITIKGIKPSASGDIVVPSEIEGYPVTRVKFTNFYMQDVGDILSLSIPDSVIYIDGTKMYRMKNLQKISVDENNMQYYTDDAGVLYTKDMNQLLAMPADCKIDSYIVPDGITEIGDYAFASNKNLISLELPESLTSVGECAIRWTDSLKSLHIPAGVKTVGDDAFCMGASMEGIFVDENNTILSSDEEGVLFDKNKTVLLSYPAANKSAEYTIPETVVTLENYSFYETLYLKTLTLTKSYEKMYSSTFSLIDEAGDEVSRITALKITEDNPNFYEEDSVFYSRDKKTLLYYFPGKTDKIFLVPDFAETIAESAFTLHLSDLTTVILSEGVRTVEKSAINSAEAVVVLNPETEIFYNKVSDSSVNVGIKSKTIYGYEGSSAQVFCDTYNSVIADSVSFMELLDSDFYKYEDKVIVFDESADFSEISVSDQYLWHFYASVSDVLICDGIRKIPAGVFAECSEPSSIIIKNFDTEIEDGAFTGCKNLKTVISFAEVQLTEAAFADTKEPVLYFAENAEERVLPAFEKLVTFTCETDSNGESTVKFTGNVEIEHYDFFNLIVALCDVYDNIVNLEFENFVLLNGNMDRVTEDGDKVDRTEITSVQNEKISVQIFDEETWEVKTVSFNQLCSGVASGTIKQFALVVFDENDDAVQDTVVDSDQEDQGIVTMILRAIITFFNKILRLFKR